MNLEQFMNNVHALRQRIEEFEQGVSAGSAEQQTRSPEAIEELHIALTELLVAEQELRQQNEELLASRQAIEAERQRYQELFEFAPDGYLVTDTEGIIREANRAAAILLNVEQRFLVGKPLANFINDTRRSAFRAFLCQVVNTPQRVELEIQLQPRGRALFEALLTVVGTRDAAGHCTGLRWLLRDISERKQAEREIQRWNAELEKRVAERTAELQRSNRDLEQFAFIVSHDLQEPLRMVSNYVQLLRKRYRGRLDAEADVFIGYAMEGAARMQELIRDLLEYSRVGTRRKEVAETNCEEVLRHVLQDLRVVIAENAASITHERLPVVMANASQLQQVWQNLLSNALKFRGQDPPRVHVAARREGPEWVFTVQDNGIGLDPRYAERIFVAFQRLHTRQHYAGTGIGLAICKKIIEQHGGRMWVESQPGQGATFYFTLPARDEAEV